MMMRGRRPALTRDFGRDRVVLAAYNQRRLGLREVPVAAITGTVGRPDLCDPRRERAWMATSRFARIRRLLAGGIGLPPVDLYLLGGHYYIRDGHHRVLAARRLGILDVEAEVTEWLPHPAAPAAAWHQARAAFERDTGLTGLHVRRPDGYELLRRQIAEHAWYLGERGEAPRSSSEAAARWERDIYRPVLADLDRHGVLGRFPELTPAELYLAVCDHKWYRSERLLRDIGFAAAVADFARRQRFPWLSRLVDGLEAARLALRRLDAGRRAGAGGMARGWGLGRDGARMERHGAREGIAMAWTTPDRVLAAVLFVVVVLAAGLLFRIMAAPLF
jgi:hypothetical protein